MLVDLIASGLRQGLLLVPLAVGVHVAFRLVRFPDLTPDGALLIGSATSALLLLRGVHPLLALLGGAVAGGALGIITSLLSELLGLDRVLAGIGTSLFAYSAALRLLGRGNVALPADFSTIYDTPWDDRLVSLGIVTVVVVFVCTIAGSRLGLRVRTVGENANLARLLGGNVKLRTLLGLLWANSCVGVSGALLMQHQRFVDVTQGTGSLFIGLACVLLGTAMPGRGSVRAAIVWSTTGAIIYACVIAGALRVGLRPGDLRALTAIFVLAITLMARRLLPGERLPLFA